ncbi:MAG: hypothetical protein EAZ97_14785 [Bacteroidetes bacterium]|nr:MAG: hypothetical protein EAZ97_14785 [Bacteroidota bacterium]
MNIRLFFFIGFFFCLFQAKSQSKDQLLFEAEKYLTDQKYQNAIEKLENLLKIDSNYQKAYYQLGIAYLENNQPSKAKKCFLKLNEVESLFDDYDFWYGKNCYYLNDFSSAKKFLEQYLQKNKKKFVKEAKKMLPFVQNGLKIMENANNYLVEHLDSTINTPESEYGALPTRDFKKMIFTRQSQALNKSEKTLEKNIMTAELSPQDTWLKAEKINNNETSSGYDAAIQLLDADRKMLVYQDGDLKITEYVDGEWKIPVMLKEGVNTPESEKYACIYDHGNRIIFSSNFEQKKHLDLYESVLQTDGTWGKPEPLENLNTSEDEDTPYITDGGKTLYFCSKGHLSMGGFDIFKSTFDPVRMAWTTPVNLGTPINSAQDDMFFTLQGELGYLTSNRGDGQGMEDIYRVYLFSNIKLKGKVLERSTNKALANCKLKFTSLHKTLEIMTDSKGNYEVLLPFHEKMHVSVFKNDLPMYEEDLLLTINAKRPQLLNRNYYIGQADESLETSPESKKYQLQGIITDKKTKQSMAANLLFVADNFSYSDSSQSNGKYDFFWKADQEKYTLTAMKKGYFYESHEFIVNENTNEKIELNLSLQAIEKNKTFVLKNIYFGSNSDQIKSESYPELNRFLAFLKLNTDLKVEISGHTDNMGNASANQILSEKRAKAIANYLIDKGIEQNRLQSLGYGASKPLVSNDDELEGRELNRRIEIKIL